MTRRSLSLSIACVYLAVASFAPAQKPAAKTEKPNYTVKKDLPYVTKGHERQVLDLYLPAGAENSPTPLPVLLWIHGGGWNQGDKDDRSPHGVAFGKPSMPWATASCMD